MDLECSLQVTEYKCVNNRKVDGRVCPTLAIVLVPLGTTYQSYLPIVSFPYFSNNFSNVPTSVHFAVGSEGETAQYVDLDDTALGLYGYNNPTYPFAPPPPLTRPQANCPFIFIGVECPLPPPNTTQQCATNWQMGERQQFIITKLICCLLKQFALLPSADTVIVGYDLDSRLDALMSLPTGMLADLQVGLTNDCWTGTPTPIPIPCLPCPTNPADCVPCEDTSCCPEHTAQIRSLEILVAEQASNIIDLEAQVGSLTAVVSGYQSVIDQIEIHYQQILARLDQHQACIDCMCPTNTVTGYIEYESNVSENAQILVPNAPTRLRMPVQITDTMPASVQNASYFLAQLQDTCQYRAEITLQLGMSDYQSGSRVWVNIITCDGTYLVTEQIMSGTGSASLFGSFLFTPTQLPCSVYFEVFTNDNLTPTKQVDFARVRIACA